jgi:hypothetical protein
VADDEERQDPDGGRQERHDRAADGEQSTPAARGSTPARKIATPNSTYPTLNTRLVVISCHNPPGVPWPKSWENRCSRPSMSIMEVPTNAARNPARPRRPDRGSWRTKIPTSASRTAIRVAKASRCTGTQAAFPGSSGCKIGVRKVEAPAAIANSRGGRDAALLPAPDGRRHLPVGNHLFLQSALVGDH